MATKESEQRPELMSPINSPKAFSKGRVSSYTVVDNCDSNQTSETCSASSSAEAAISPDTSLSELNPSIGNLSINSNPNNQIDHEDEGLLHQSLTDSSIDLLASCTTKILPSESNNQEEEFKESEIKQPPTSSISFREPKHGRTVLHQQIRLGQTPVVKQLVSAIPSLLKLKDYHGNHALHFAVSCSKGYRVGYELTSYLLKSSNGKDGADHSIVNGNGYTPLHVHILTLKVDRVELLQLLLSHGAHPDLLFICSGEETSPLRYAVEKSFVKVACMLVQYGASFSTSIADARLPALVTTIPTKLRRQFIASIVTAPEFASTDDINECIECHDGPFVDRNTKKRGGFFKSLLRKRVKVIEHCQCYYCGLVYCTKSSCAVGTKFNSDILPCSGGGGNNSFRKTSNDENPTSPVSAAARKKRELALNPELCVGCEKLLTSRHLKSRKSVRFLGKALGYDE